MKKSFILLTVLLLVFGLSLSAGTKEFGKKSKFITGELGFSSWSTPIGVSYEMGYNENIGIGAAAWLLSWDGATLITPSVFAQYHFTKLKVKKLDVAAGASLGYSIFSAGEITGSSSLFLSGLLTVRYYFSDKLAISLKETYSFIGDWSGSYTMIGVTYRLN